nr:SidA/IucD/PvdA family monooxygenase [Mesorhizobium sp. M5C.F.Ca.IN.020.29.1.1]
MRTDDAVLSARDLVIGIGKQARIPSQFQSWIGRNLFHSSDLLHNHPEVRQSMFASLWRPVRSRGAVAPVEFRRARRWQHSSAR